MPLSGDPRARAAQLANLRPGARVDHGATGQLLLSPLREKHRAALQQDYPGIDERRLALLSDLLSRIELASGYIDRRGLVKDRRTLEPRPLVKLIDQWQARAWRLLDTLDGGGGEGDAQAALDAVLAEYAAKDDDE
jgi:hypothetical protein